MVSWNSYQLVPCPYLRIWFRLALNWWNHCFVSCLRCDKWENHFIETKRMTQILPIIRNTVRDLFTLSVVFQCIWQWNEVFLCTLRLPQGNKTSPVIQTDGHKSSKQSFLSIHNFPRVLQLSISRITPILCNLIEPVIFTASIKRLTPGPMKTIRLLLISP